MFFDAQTYWLNPDISKYPGNWTSIETPHGNVVLSGHDGAHEIVIIFTGTPSTMQAMLIHCEANKIMRSVSTAAGVTASDRAHIAKVLNNRLREIIVPASKRPVFIRRPA